MEWPKECRNLNLRMAYVNLFIQIGHSTESVVSNQRLHFQPLMSFILGRWQSHAQLVYAHVCELPVGGSLMFSDRFERDICRDRGCMRQMGSSGNRNGSHEGTAC